jgi:Peptidase M15
MRRVVARFIAPVIVATAVSTALAIAGCGSSDSARRAAPDPTGPLAALPQAHPQAIEPAAGVQAASGTAAPVGDVNAHAAPLSEIKRELKDLNLCGGAVSAADAAPIATSTGPGFVADPGTSQAEGELPVITADLNALGRALGVTIYGISGYRTPAESVAVGGYADDPHTKGLAEDIGVNRLLRSSAAQISEAELARFGLYRPFDPSDDPSNNEVNHVQLIPSGGPLTLAESEVSFDPDPTCK